MEKIPTAEDFFIDWYKRQSYEEITDQTNRELKLPTEVMIEFTKLHVKAALLAASRKVRLNNSDEWIEDEFGGCDNINTDSILSAYPDKNIE